MGLLSKLRSWGVAALLAGATFPAFAVSEAALGQAERLWNKGELSAAVAMLDTLVEQMERQGDFHNEALAGRAYWLQAQAHYRHRQRCEPSYKAVVKLTRLNYLRHQPNRKRQYEALVTKLHKCVEEPDLDVLTLEALTELSAAALSRTPANSALASPKELKAKAAALQASALAGASQGVTAPREPEGENATFERVLARTADNLTRGAAFFLGALMATVMAVAVALALVDAISAAVGKLRAMLRSSTGAPRVRGAGLQVSAHPTHKRRRARLERLNPWG